MLVSKFTQQRNGRLRAGSVAMEFDPRSSAGAYRHPRAGGLGAREAALSGIARPSGRPASQSRMPGLGGRGLQHRIANARAGWMPASPVLCIPEQPGHFPQADDFHVVRQRVAAIARIDDEGSPGRHVFAGAAEPAADAGGQPELDFNGPDRPADQGDRRLTAQGGGDGSMRPARNHPR